MRKKITSLFALFLLVAGTAIAQPSVDGKLFTLKCARGYVYYNGSVLKGTSDASQASQFAIVEFGGTTYLYDATNNAFVVHSTAATAGTAGNYALESTTDFSKAVTGLKWGDTGIASYPYYLEDSYGNWLNMDKIPIVYFNTWKDFEGGNGGNTYAVNVVGDFDPTAAKAMLMLPSVDGKLFTLNGKLFTLNCARGYVYYDGTQLKGTRYSALASQFAIVECGGTTYLYDATNGAFVVHTTAATAGTTGNNALESTTDLSKAVKGLKWGDTGIASYPYYLEDSYGNWLYMDNIPNVYFNTWKDFEDGTGGNTYAVNVVGDFDATAAKAMLMPSLDGKLFTLNCARGYVYYDGTQLKGTSDASQASQFAIVSYGETNYLYDATNGAFVVHTTAATTGSSNAALERTTDLSKAVTGLKWGDTGIASYPYYLEDSYGNWLNMDKIPNVYFNTWKDFEGGNGGNTYTINVVGDFDATAVTAMIDYYFNPSATVQYVIKDVSGNVVDSTEAKPAYVGNDITTLPAELQRPYCSYAVKPTTIAAGANVVDVTVTYNLPFTLSSSYADASWYFMTVRGHYVYYAETSNDIRTNQVSKGEPISAYEWAFMGDPYSGIKVINKAVGEGKYMSYTYSGGTVQMGTYPYAWTIESLNGTPTFGLRYGRWYINEQNTGNHNLIYSDFLTNTGSQFTVEEALTVNVTYDLYENGTKVDSKVVEQEAKSSVTIPTAWTAAYDTFVWDITTEGTIGYRDCTINVTANLKDGIVYPISNLSNNKAYRVVVKRGTYTTNNGLLANTVKNSSYAINNFAFIEYEGNYYMWSVADSKFVAGNVNTLSDEPAAVEFVDNSFPFYQIKSGYKYLNASVEHNTGADFGPWITASDGNRCLIYEAEDFDPTAVVALLDEYFHTGDKTAKVVAEVYPYIFADPTRPATSDIAPTVGHPFGISAEAANNFISTFSMNIVRNSFNTEEYAAAKAMVEAGIIYPADGFYRVKNVSTGKYLRAINLGARGGVVADLTAEQAASDAASVIEVRTIDGKPYMLSNTGWFNWVFYNANYKAFVSAAQDKYVHWLAVAPGQGAFSIAYGNGEGEYEYYLYYAYYSVYADNTLIGSLATSDAAYWVFEPATDVTVNMNVVGDASYATAVFPFPVEVSGAKVMRVEANIAAGKAKYYETANTIPAGTPVMLVDEDGAATATATIIDSADELTEQNDLVGNYFAGNVTDALVLGASSGVIGFYKLSATGTLGANRAYIDNSTSSDVRALVLAAGETTDETTGITGVATEAAQNGEVYDLSGRRVQNVGNGLYIINGKKVLVK